MKSPRFDIRAIPIRKIFLPSNIEKIWREKVRISMREQFLNDGVENFDFHVSRKIECKKLSQLILSGEYAPSRAQRILVEKSKGLCRQLVIPSVRDALVLQCLSDAFYQEIRGKAPTQCSFFEPKEHRFTTARSKYGNFASWLNFQKGLFNFSRTRAFVVVTDIANYYDSISYTHLRNAISGISGEKECVLDMLIYVLSGLLWQPDYTPRVEIGLPQINLDAPRLLAHCFLYELDEFIASDSTREFVRYMDDIDVGVDNIPAAKEVLKSIDLVLQTRQIRLNGGKTLILSSAEAMKHFRVHENARLDFMEKRIKIRIKNGLDLSRDRKLIKLRLERGLSKKLFDSGNGEKVLKRWITLAGITSSHINLNSLSRVFLLRPSVRENVCIYLRRSKLTPARSKMLASVSESQSLVDDAALVDLTNHLVETLVPMTGKIHDNLIRIIEACRAEGHFGLYCKLWLQSKYDSPTNLLNTIRTSRNMWTSHERLGRLIGGFRPLFESISERDDYLKELFISMNPGFRDTYLFHGRLSRDKSTFDLMYEALKNPNGSRGTGITHAKFLCLLSALKNKSAAPARIQTLKNNNHVARTDIYYRKIMRRCGV